MNANDKRIVAALIRKGAEKYPHQAHEAYCTEEHGVKKVCSSGAACIGAGMTYEELDALYERHGETLEFWNTDAMIARIQEKAPSFDEFDFDLLIRMNDDERWSFDKIVADLEYAALSDERNEANDE